MATERKYPVKLTRIQVRNLWADIQNATAGNRSQEDWLVAANRELEPHAEVKVGLARLSFPELKEPDVVIQLKLSFAAACGAKLAMVQSAKGAAFRKRVTIQETADGFGLEFSKLVRKAISLEDSKDLDEDSELNGVPCEDRPAGVVELKKES